MSVFFNRFLALYEAEEGTQPHEEVVEACKLTQEQYSAIQERLLPDDRNELVKHFDIVEKNVRRLTEEADTVNKKNLFHTIMKSLLVIRYFQNPERPIDGLDASADSKALEAAYKQLAPDQRCKTACTMLFQLKKLPTASQRHAALLIFAKILPMDGLTVMIPVTAIARVVKNVTHVQTLEKFFYNLPADSYLDYIQHLSYVLPRVSPDDWNGLHERLQGTKICRTIAALESQDMNNRLQKGEVKNPTLLTVAELSAMIKSFTL